MYSELGQRVVAVDLDPQANLTAFFLKEERLEKIWPWGRDDPNSRRDHSNTTCGRDHRNSRRDHSNTIFGCVQPLIKGRGDITEPHLEFININNTNNQNKLALLPGDLYLSLFEGQLSEVWPKCMDKDERAFLVISAFWRIMQKAATKHKADVILVDLGPNLGAINRAALIAADYIVLPLSPDLFSLRGLRNLGPTLQEWRKEWKSRLAQKPDVDDLDLPQGQMNPLGYVVLQHSERLNRPVKSYKHWIAKIPNVYKQEVLYEEQNDKEANDNSDKEVNDNSQKDDPNCLALIKNYKSLMPKAQKAHKPIFSLTSADGAIGSHLNTVKEAYKAFESLAIKIQEKLQALYKPGF